MPNTLLEKPAVSTLTVKLESIDRDRLKSLAVAKRRTPHFLMKVAIQKYLEEEEAEQRFIEVAREALADFRKTGKHLGFNELDAWVDNLEKDPNAVLPACHK